MSTLLFPRFRYTTSELERIYLSCAYAKEQSRWHAIWLLSRRDLGLTKEQVATLMGYNLDWVRKTIHRYNQGNDASMADGRRTNHRPHTLNAKSPSINKMTPVYCSHVSKRTIYHFTGSSR